MIDDVKKKNEFEDNNSVSFFDSPKLNQWTFKKEVPVMYANVPYLIFKSHFVL